MNDTVTDHPIALVVNAAAAATSIDAVSINSSAADTTVDGSDVVSDSISDNVLFDSADSKFELVVNLDQNIGPSDDDPLVDVVCWVGEDIKDNISTVRLYRKFPWTSNKELVGFMWPQSNRGSIVLDQPMQMSKLYLEFEISNASAFTSAGIRLHSFCAGQGIRLPNRPLRPYTRHELKSSFSDFESDSGFMRRYVFYRGRSMFEHRFQINSDAEESVFQKLYDDTKQFSIPFYWIEEPKTDPHRPMFVYAQDKFSVTFIGPIHRETSLSLREQGPRFSRDSNA